MDSDLRLVPKNIDEDVEDARHEFEVIEEHSVRVHTLRDKVVLDRGEKDEQREVHNLHELSRVAFQGFLFVELMRKLDGEEQVLQLVTALLGVSILA